VLIDAGIRTIVQPGGSVRDQEVIDAARAAGVTMFFTESGTSSTDRLTPRHPRGSDAARCRVRFPRAGGAQPCQAGRMPHVDATAAMTFDERYRAIDARDVRFDGQFVTAVRSTGIYCRPSCPRARPSPPTSRSIPTSAAAHEAGYRACKRCLPEAAPGSPAWNLRGDVAGRAMRLIADGVVEREGVPGSRRLGYSARHLTRLLTAELGAGPSPSPALSAPHRADAPRIHRPAGRRRRLLRRIRERPPVQRHGPRGVRPSPSDLRARRPAAARTVSTPAAGTIDLVLPHRAPFDAAGLFAWMRARAVAGVEEAGDDAFARVLRLPGGPAWFAIRLDDAGSCGCAPG
jgi:AraC family transcriptional regulator of adaptative response / DNA-3-methyladenine glycosylase II